MNVKTFLCLFMFVLLSICAGVEAKKIAYIYGDVSAEGDIPSGSKAPFHQMLLTDGGSRGCSIFKAMVESKGHTITQYYDRETVLTAEFLSQFDVVIFGLHQKQWSAAEKAALDNWIRAGGSIFIYSDSASGGLWSSVGGHNPVGQTVVNNILAQYGMQVTVDQCNGVKAYRAGPNASHPIVVGRPVWEGEGVSPVAIDPHGGAVALIPYINHADYKVSGNPDIPRKENITIQNPVWAALALQKVGKGHVIVGFDRQPMWNGGEGSDITKRDNKEILSRIIDFTTGAISSAASFTATPTSGDAPLTVSFDASGSTGDNLTYSWNFGDQTTATGVTAQHTYITAGSYTVTLEIDDGDETHTARTTITVSAPPAPIAIPGTIQAQDFAAQSGIEAESTSDQSGGENIGHINNNDWAEYAISVATAGSYTVAARVASQTQGGTIAFTTGSTTLGEIAVPGTGGWQSWTTVSTVVELAEGTHTLRTTFTGGSGFLLNVNYYEVTANTQTAVRHDALRHTRAFGHPGAAPRGRLYTLDGKLIPASSFRSTSHASGPEQARGSFIEETSTGLRRSVRIKE